MIIATIANSFFNDQFDSRFESLGFPLYIIMPLMVIKVLGLIAIWSHLSRLLLEWAYAGFFFLLLIAFLAEFHAVQPDFLSPVIGLGMTISSYIVNPYRLAFMGSEH